MNRCVNGVITACALVLGIATAQAQEGGGQNQAYLTVMTLKVLPGQANALAEHYKTGAGAKTIQARIKQNPNLMRWTLLRNVDPGDSGSPSDHIIAIAMKGAPAEPDPAANERVAKEFAGMSYSDYMQKIRTMTTQVGQSLSHIHHTTAGYGPVEGDYVVIRRLKARENQQQNMMRLAREYQLPLAEERVKSGATKGWSFSHLTFPAGAAAEYDATDVRVYKDLASAIGAGGGGGGGNAAVTRFAEKFPNQSYTNYIDALRAASRIVRTDIYRVVAAYRQ